MENTRNGVYCSQVPIVFFVSHIELIIPVYNRENILVTYIHTRFSPLKTKNVIEEKSIREVCHLITLGGDSIFKTFVVAVPARGVS
jgi:hypothetical protein